MLPHKELGAEMTHETRRAEIAARLEHAAAALEQTQRDWQEALRAETIAAQRAEEGMQQEVRNIVELCNRKLRRHEGAARLAVQNLQRLADDAQRGHSANFAEQIRDIADALACLTAAPLKKSAIYFNEGDDVKGNLSKSVADTIEAEMRRLEADPAVGKHELRLFMQHPMPCGHAVGNLLTCADPPYGCVICGEARLTAAPEAQPEGEKPTRCEVIDSSGRILTRWPSAIATLSWQDGVRTIKVFLDSRHAVSEGTPADKETT